jgi:hypothetical protein
MPDDPDVPTGGAGPVVTANPGLAALLAEAQQTWVGRARDVAAAKPGWRPFEDAFPTFYQFTNRPR